MLTSKQQMLARRLLIATDLKSACASVCIVKWSLLHCGKYCLSSLCRPDMRKLCLHEVFHPGMTFHAGMKRRHEIFMPPRDESFISPRHHINTTVAQTSTRYENLCRHETHAGMSFMSGLM